MSLASRRSFMQTATAVPFMLSLADSPVATATEQAKSASGATAFDYRHSPVSLPFDPKRLTGLSERLMQSHWEHNYIGSVKALNTIRGRLSQALNDTSTPPYVYNDLKREHLMRTGSVVLHELYFANLGGNGKADASLRTRIAQSFGTFDAWETEFRKIGLGLGGGSGWVMLGYNHRLNLLENYWMADHTTAPAFTTPLLVMDMYEHSYQMDYGAATAKYIDAFFANINWDEVARRT